jgi:hypothetical protein
MILSASLCFLYIIFQNGIFKWIELMRSIHKARDVPPHITICSVLAPEAWQYRNLKNQFTPLLAIQSLTKFTEK